MKLFIIIPAYNEENSIGAVIKEIPRDIKEINEVKVLVVDDGSIDKTVQMSKEARADYIFRNKANKGLAFSFGRGLDESLKLGADIIVNTDADFQYDQSEIPNLIKPILDDKADMVFGDRQISKLSHMSLNKKYGNIIGSFFLRLITGSNIRDASSGFRAFSRKAAMQFLIFSNHTYTHETIIQAIAKKMRIVQIPIIFKKREKGKSKLIKGFFGHIKRSLFTILRVVLIYKPLKIFFIFGSVCFCLGSLLSLRYLYFYFIGITSGHIQSLILASILISIGVIVIVMGLLADLINTNRKIIEEVLLKLREKDYQRNNDRKK
ncbi:MAG: glycosyltransferase family 2 protein [Patescibacteria group bacterium]